MCKLEQSFLKPKNNQGMMGANVCDKCSKLEPLLHNQHHHHHGHGHTCHGAGGPHPIHGYHGDPNSGYQNGVTATGGGPAAGPMAGGLRAPFGYRGNALSVISEGDEDNVSDVSTFRSSMNTLNSMNSLNLKAWNRTGAVSGVHFESLGLRGVSVESTSGMSGAGDPKLSDVGLNVPRTGSPSNSPSHSPAPMGNPRRGSTPPPPGLLTHPSQRPKRGSNPERGSLRKKPPAPPAPPPPRSFPPPPCPPPRRGVAVMMTPQRSNTKSSGGLSTKSS